MLRKSTGTVPVFDLEPSSSSLATSTSGATGEVVESKKYFSTSSSSAAITTTSPSAGPTRPPNYRETVWNYREGKAPSSSSTTTTPQNTPALPPTTPPLAPTSSSSWSAKLPPPAFSSASTTGSIVNKSISTPSSSTTTTPMINPKQKSVSPPNNNNSNNNKNKQQSKTQLSFTLSPALPQSTSTHPPPLILTATTTTALPPPQYKNQANNNNKTNNNNSKNSPTQNNNNNNQPRRKIVYSRSQMMNIGKHVVTSEPDARTVRAIVDACPDIATDVCYEILRREEVRLEQQFSYECKTCSLFDMSDEDINNNGIVKAPPAGACDQMQELIKNSLKDCRSARRGLTFICQSPEAVFAMLRLSVLTDPKRASKKVRAIPSRCVDRIKSFLCGGGFHFPAPAQGDDASWNRFSVALNFDKIMENQTPLFAGLGKYWKKHHTAFEKFVQILFWRDEAPNPNNFNMINKNQMPVIVACSAGDVDAAVMLMHLKFHVLADDYLFAFPFMRTVDPLKAAVLRHLCRYFFRKQTERVLAARAVMMMKVKG